MVFSSHPLYQLDPPNWQYHQQQQQQLILYGGGNEISSSNNNLGNPPLQQPPAATGGSRNIRPGSMTDRARMAKVPLPEIALKCPRCESTNTKFCYFNNYSLTQPRHFCKTCRRYWTRGGALRNVPVGGGCRRSTKRSSKKRSKSPAVVSGTVTVTTTTGSTDQVLGDMNCSNLIDVVQFPVYPHGMNQMGHGFGDHYICGGNNFGGAQTDPHIANLLQTHGVMSLAESSMDQQWSTRLADTTLTQMHSPPFPFLTNLAQQEHSSQPSGHVYQFDQCGGGHMGLSGSNLDSLGSMISHCNTVNVSTVDRNFGNQFTDVKMEDGKKGLKRLLGMQELPAASNTSMADDNRQFRMAGNRTGIASTDLFGFTTNATTTSLDG